MLVLKNKIIVILLLIFIINSLFLKRIISNEAEILNEEKIEYYYADNSIDEESYIGVLKIPSINLIRGFYSFDSKLNNVNYNIEVIKDDMDHILILASHRGNSKVSFFNDLELLDMGDEIYLDYLHHEYKYKLYYKYYEQKDGKLAIKYDDTRETLVLITCDRKDKTKQVIYVSYKI